MTGDRRPSGVAPPGAAKPAAAPRSALRWVFRETLHGRTRVLARLAGWSVVEAVPGYLSGRAVAYALDDGFLAGRPATGLGWLALLAVAFVLAGIGVRGSVRCLAELVEPVRDRLVRLVVTATLRRATEPPATGELGGVARLTLQTEIVREALANTMTAGRGFLVATTAGLAGLAGLRPWFALLVLPPMTAALAVLAVLLRRQVALQREQVLVDERIADAAGRVAAGLRDITACGAEQRAHDLVGTHIDRQLVLAGRAARLQALSSGVVGLGGWLPLALLLTAAPALLDSGVTPGVIAGAVTYLVQAIRPALRTLVAGLTGSGTWLITATGRILQISADTAARPAGQPGRAGPTQASAGDGDLRLCRVTFRYGPAADPVLREFDLAVPDGDHLAIVGPSGAGKSTLAALMSGMLRPAQGEVLLGDLPLTRLDPYTLAERRVVIPQEAYVFAGTVRENLAYHRPDVPAAEVAEAVDLVGLAPLVRRLGGPDGRLEPQALSAGERQLVALARAYLSPARMAVLDEATCHLDPVAEARVEQVFARRPGTLVVVAHRISSALRARRILVLDRREVRVGDHESLLVSSPLYRELVQGWQVPDVLPAGAAGPAPAVGPVPAVATVPAVGTVPAARAVPAAGGHSQPA